MGQDLTTLIRNIEELHSLEKQAYHLYETILPKIADPHDRQTVEGIMRDELRHAQLAEEIIALLRQ